MHAAADNSDELGGLGGEPLNDDVQHRRPEEHVVDALRDGLVHRLHEAVPWKRGAGG